MYAMWNSDSVLQIWILTNTKMVADLFSQFAEWRMKPLFFLPAERTTGIFEREVEGVAASVTSTAIRLNLRFLEHICHTHHRQYNVRPQTFHQRDTNWKRRPINPSVDAVQSFEISAVCPWFAASRHGPANAVT